MRHYGKTIRTVRRLLNKGGMKNNQLSKLETVSLKKLKPASGRYRKWHRKEFKKADEEIIRCKKRLNQLLDLQGNQIDWDEVKILQKKIADLWH